jgi:hypothetical protein
VFHLVNFIAGMQLIVSNAHQRKALSVRIEQTKNDGRRTLKILCLVIYKRNEAIRKMEKQIAFLTSDNN